MSAERHTDVLGPLSSPESAIDLRPHEAATRLLEWSRAKAALPTDRAVVLGLMAGAFISLGAIFFIAIMAEVPLGHGPSRLIASIAFSMGLLLVCMTAAELSTGNCMIIASWAQREMSSRDVVRILATSFLWNIVGALVIALAMQGAGLLDGLQGRIAAQIAEAKASVPLSQAFVRAILCNALVCLAVWMILSTRTLPGKFMGLVLPIAAFVAIGFEHSVANVYLMAAGAIGGASVSPVDASLNLAVVTFGNLIGGALVALALWVAHVRKAGQAVPDAVSMVQKLANICVAGVQRGIIAIREGPMRQLGLRSGRP